MARHWYSTPETANLSPGDSMFEDPPPPDGVLVYENPDDETPLHVWATIDGAPGEEVVLLDQGGDKIAVPMADFGEFVSALEKLYAP